MQHPFEIRFEVGDLVRYAKQSR